MGQEEEEEEEDENVNLYLLIHDQVMYVGGFISNRPSIYQQQPKMVREIGRNGYRT